MPEYHTTLTRRRFLAGAGTATFAAAATATTAMPAENIQFDTSTWQKTSDRKIRIGVVGGGFGASFQWNHHPNCQVEAVSDLQPSRRENLMRVFQCGKSYPSLEQLVKDPAIEAVAVFTDAPSHGRHCVLVMEHGKHCLSAVPAAFTLDDCQKLIDTKERTGLKYMMAETSYYHRAVIRARNLYSAGYNVVYSEGQYYHDGVTAVPSWQNWRYALPPMFYPTHSTAYYVGVTRKRLTKVTCLGWRGEGAEWQKNRYDDNPFVNESAMFHTSEGTMFRCNVFWECDLGGEYGMWVWQNEPNVAVADRVPLPPGLEYGGHGGSHGPLVNEFLTALLEDRQPAIDVHEAVAMTAPGIVAHQSALHGGEMRDIPRFDGNPNGER